MNVFVLEDNSERISFFFDRYLKDNLVVCNNAKQACDILVSNKFDLIFLDHDLEGRVYVPESDPNNGTRVCEAIVKSKNMKTPIIVHSYNHVAAERMVEILRSGSENFKIVWEPFGTEEFLELVKKFSDNKVV